VSKGNDYIGIRQKPYIEKKVEEFALKECNLVTTPMESGFYVADDIREHLVSTFKDRLRKCLKAKGDLIKF